MLIVQLLEVTFVNQLLQTTLLEWIGFFTTIWCIYLAAKENVWNWPISIISIFISALLYFESQLYGDFLLQFYFLFTAFYGWWYWLRRKKQHEKPIARINTKQWVFVIVSIAILTYLLGYFLDNFTQSNVPYEDGFCTAVSFVAQLMLSRKILENWILWIVVDACYVPLLIYKNLNLYAILYGILVVIAVIGYKQWIKTYHEQAN